LDIILSWRSNQSGDCVNGPGRAQVPREPVVGEADAVYGWGEGGSQDFSYIKSFDGGPPGDAVNVKVYF
jgi:hypothetical protein